MAKAPPTKTSNFKGIKKSSKAVLGAPSQLNQSSRKGKRAWRKNVDIQDVEEAMEDMRAEERVTGKALQNTTDKDLFQIDLQGDAQLRKSLNRFSKSQLTSTKILAQRSAVPAVFSRPSNSSSQKKKPGLSQEAKGRLLRMAKRPQKGPFNSVVDPTQPGAGSALLELSAAVKSSGTYDAWGPPPIQEDIKIGLETVRKQRIKPPNTTHVRDAIELPAIVEPHQGTSYNPPVASHQELLLKAHEAEEQRAREADRLAQVKEKFERAKENAIEEGDVSLAPGMKLDRDVMDSEDEIKEARSMETMLVKKPSSFKKTPAQKRKAARLLAEKRELSERVSRKRLLAMIPSVKAFRRMNAKASLLREKQLIAKRLALKEKLKQQGLAGRKFGKHKVPSGRVDVQLGEELSESLRELKPEGNLFRDRFISLQQRALIEPRVPVLPKKRRTKIVQYEKHAWKRFDRE